MNNQERLSWLVEQVLAQKADDRMLAELQQLLRDEEGTAHAARMEALLTGDTSLPAYDRQAWEPVVDAILAADKQPPARGNIRRLRYWWAAAAVLVGTGIFLLTRPAPSPQTAAVTPATVNDAVPGTNKATLTLADGSVVTLDSSGNAVLQQGGTAIRQHGGQLSYDAQGMDAVVSYNILKTPRGGQFQLKLPDGTVVWLNAASSLRYPTAFTGKERKVDVTGEAYFEVAKNANMPFIVNVNDDAAIEVLGTHFNVQAYEDEVAMQTTLLEGAVKVNGVPLKPGQQAQLSNGAVNVTDHANIEKVMAWKNGVFDFNNASLQEVMRQLSRWYDIEVVYSAPVQGPGFWGKMGRNLTLSQVLKGLESAEVHFRIEENGKKLVVLP